MGNKWDRRNENGAAFGRRLGGGFSAKSRVVAKGVCGAGMTRSGRLPCNSQDSTISIVVPMSVYLCLFLTPLTLNFHSENPQFERLAKPHPPIYLGGAVVNTESLMGLSDRGGHRSCLHHLLACEGGFVGRMVFRQTRGLIIIGVLPTVCTSTTLIRAITIS